MCNRAYQFFLGHKVELVRLVESYLAHQTDIDSIREYAWKVLDDWDKLEKVAPVPENEPYGKGEKAFWAIIWDAQHLADEGPMRDELNRREIQELFESLKNMDDVLKVDAKRP